MPHYYLHRDEDIHGPYEKSQMKQMIASGEIQKDELICDDNGSEWRPASILLLKPIPKSATHSENNFLPSKVDANSGARCTNAYRTNVEPKPKAKHSTEGIGRLVYSGSIIGVFILIFLAIALTGGKTIVFNFLMIIIFSVLLKVTIDRIKNTGESQWMILTLFIPIASLIFIIYWCFKPPENLTKMHHKID